MQFPAEFDLCRANYSRNLKGEVAPQTFDAWQRQRRNVRRRGVTDTVCWMLTESQCRELQIFHRKAGGDYFEIDLPAYTGITKTAARFDGPLTISPVRDCFEVTASLYIPQPLIIPADELEDWLLEAIGVTDDQFGNPLYYWANINWGVLWNTGISDSNFNQSIHQFVNHQWSSLLTGVTQ